MDGCALSRISHKISLKDIACTFLGEVLAFLMNRSQVVAAIESGNAFSIRMADGKEYEVPHRDYISLSPVGTFVTVYDDEGKYFVLPLITMTGIASDTATNDASA